MDAGTLNTPHLQRELCLLLEAASFDKFLVKAAEVDDRTARRVKELADSGTCHDWMWKINPRHGSRLSESDYQICFGSRFGAEQVDSSIATCKLCGEALDGAASH
eukprot:121607-Karenia_brevis.AAC.1